MRHPSQRQAQAPSTLAALLHEQARRRGDAPALLAPGRDPLSHAGLLAQVQHLGDRLHALGATPATRVAVVLPNGPEMAVAFLGVAAHAACAPLNPAYQAEELRFHLQDTRADMLLMPLGAPGPAREVALALGVTLIEIDIDDSGPAGRFRVAGELPPSLADRAACAPDDIALLLHTSGTTARPKLVPLSQAQLMASAHNIAAHLGLSVRDRCLNVMPLFHIHGLVGALLATLAGGGSIVCAPGFDDEAYFDWIAAFDPSWTTAVPTIHQALLAHGERYRQKAPAHRFRFVRSSSAALPAATLRALQDLLQAPVVEAYGMTEASHQMASNPLQAGEQTPGSVGAASGAQIVILDANSARPLGPGRTGEVAIRGPGVMRGYENNPQANAEAFHDGWFRTGDLGHLDVQGRLFISGRLKEMINRGGEKVSPREVDDALLDHPDVRQAATFGLPHPSLGEDLAAAVVRRAGSAVDEAGLRDYLFTRVAGFKVPSQIVFVHAIPTGATGKVQRGELHRLLAAALTCAFEPAASATEHALAAIFADVLESDPPGRHDNFFARGGDSLKGARVIARVNQRFGVNLPVTSLFRHPSVAELATQVHVLESSSADESAAPVLRPRPPGERVPCSSSQQALWVVERLLGGAGVYNNTQAVRIAGPLDAPALDRALQALVQRHEVLRTGVEERDGVPVQRVHSKATVRLARFDAFDVGAPGQEAALQQRLLEQAGRPFDLAQAPLLRASLWRLAPRDHVLLLVVHHLVTDGWSAQVIARDLGALYSAFSEGRTPALLPLPVQFADWAQWQRERLQGERLATDLRFWRRQLAGLVPLALPTDRPRPPLPSYAGRAEHITVPVPLLAPLQALAREHDATLFMLLLAAFKVLLMRCTQQDDVAVGSPVAGRDRPELEGLVGCFVNSVVLRTDMAGNPRFGELLARVRQTALDGYAHQELPFDHLVAELSPQRDLSRNPLVQVSFALNNHPAPVYALNGVEARSWPLPTAFAKFDLSLSFVEAGDQLQGVVEYSTDLFDAATVRRLGSHLLNLLAGIVADPGQRVGRLPLLGDAEWHRMRVDWNHTGPPSAPALPIHTRVAQQARRTPDAVALELGEQRLSYGHLNAQANQLAHHLRHWGVAPEVPVAVCMERSPQMVVAMLAVLKAGGAVLPLDPALPPQRLALMLQDTAAPVLLMQASLSGRFANPVSASLRHRLCLDTQWRDVADAPEDEGVGAATNATPTQLAYVIYTSGSTGVPKGVLLEHGAWANHVQWMQHTLRVMPADRFLQITAIGFDAAMVELFMPLQAGATLVLAEPGEHRDLAYVARVVREQAITVLQMVPSALRGLLAEPGFDGRSLRQVICGGEAMDRALANELQQRLPQATLGNFYGPTETAIDATHFEVLRPFDGTGGAPNNVPIGRPIANTRCHVLDRHLQPVPVGVTGELFVGGAGLARGYLNQPRLTAERFIADPFEAGQRLYRTGDLARYRADGLIECLGRVDAQVKIRGQRIELGEVEAALKALPGVQDGMVLAREDEPGLKRLVAYVIGDAPGAAELKAGLARQLPDAMLPTAFVVLAQWPRLPNGKVDRRALPAPEHAPERANGATGTAPRTATELALQQIWRDVLHIDAIDAIGVHDHFFELGGHSLLATQVVSRLRAALHIELPLRAMFEHPTLQALAAQVDRARADHRRRHGKGDGSRPPVIAPSAIPRIGRDGPLAVSYSQRRMWLVQTLNPRTRAYNMCFGLRLLGPLDGDALVEAIDAVVQRHETFRTRFGAVHGEVVQWVDPPRPAVVERIDLRGLPAGDAEREALARREQIGGGRFDLAVSGLYRICLLQLADAEHVLLWVNHHSIGDHWSDGILLREVGQAYAARLQGRTAELPPLPIEYADYAAWQRADAQRASLAPHMAYWTRRLQGLQPLPLPHDLAWRELPSGRGGSVSTQFSASTLAALKRLCGRQGVTPFMALLACFKQVLSRYSGQTDIAVASPVANRTRVEAESLVGTLVNTLVMRTDLSGELSWGELLTRVRETALEAFEHQDAPFERLVEEIHVDRSSHRQPLVQVLFNLTNAPFDVNALPGVRLQPFEYASTAAQFELGLNVDDAFGDVRLTYSTDLFVPSTAARLLDGFLTVVEQMLANPDMPVHDVDVLSPAERAMLQQWNATDVPFEPGLRLGDLIRRQVQASPDACAVVFKDRQLSYRELDATACTLAQYLRRLGAGPGVLVGVCLERCPELVGALLGVVYSGAAYVPLDPAYPPDRLARMAEDAGMTLVLSRAAEWQRLGLALPASLRMIDIDTPMPEPSSETPAGFELIGTAQDPAYVIFTSGSTGRPKGAMNAHAGVVNWLQWMQSEYRLTSQDRVLLKTPYSFDVSLREFFWPLMTGATLVVARPDGHRDSAYLAGLIRRERITLLHFVPSMLRVFLDEPDLPAQCASVRRVVCSGEALPADVVALFFQRLPRVRLCNLYGPTEAAVEVTYWECRPGDGQGSAAGGPSVPSGPSVPIGRPVANTQMHVLDGRLRPQPIGVPGESYIGGVQVGMGYVGRPELTAERFIADPFNPGWRLYKTGDLARWTRDGVIDYLGRADDQVKIRGHRIELGEIEVNLGTHPEVARCVVIVREDSPGDRRLVAYVVPRAMAPEAAALREHLRTSLPEFMLPQHVVSIEALPLLTNGKLDRKALPMPDPAAQGAERQRDGADAPQTGTERLIADVWQGLLGVPHVGRSDNFFDLGGHSLLAMRVVNELERRASVKLDLRRLVFESLAQVAASVDGAAGADGAPPPRRSSLFGRLLDGIGLGRPGGPS